MDYEHDLDDEAEVGIKIGGDDPAFYLKTMIYWEPDLLAVVGVGFDGVPVRYLHGTAAFGYLLVALPKRHAKAVRVGAVLKARSEEK